MTKQSKPALLVAGDVTADWILAVPSSANLESAYQWQRRVETNLSAQPGGAALLARLIESTALPDLRVSGPAIARADLLDPEDGRWARTYSLWQPRPRRLGSPDIAWRMHQFYGVRPAAAGSPSAPDSERPRFLAIDDSGLGFRDDAESWPAALQSPDTLHHIVLKMAAPLASSSLWELLTARFADRLTVYLSLGDLRRDDATIGQPLSWEQLATEIVNAVAGDAELAKAARVVVSVGYAGAVLVCRKSAMLVFDPLHQEADWERSRPGSPSGLGTCLTAALAVEPARNPERPQWDAAIIRGLLAGRAAHESGNVLSESTAEVLSFPVAEAARYLSDDAPIEETFSVAPVNSASGWQLLATGDSDYMRLATAIVIAGDIDACRGMPVERMGHWTSIDRTEIESVRSLRNIVRQYLNLPARSRPLSVAVFGPPGAGKSFAVKQMAREWSSSGLRVDVLEFNVAQFSSQTDLAGALQRVRDSAVQQALPLVFWDEFDSPLNSAELGWLARFLAPMQDGTFLEDGNARPIGPAIFVFAGGTHPTLASFMERAVTIPGAKATDFLSRLRGHIDVLGPNPQDEADRGFVLRRALLLRSLLLAKAPQLGTDRKLSIDPGVLSAFLSVPMYLHGARSLEAVIDMSALAGRLRYERSALPARHQLALHVDAELFLKLAQGRTERELLPGHG